MGIGSSIAMDSVLDGVGADRREQLLSLLDKMAVRKVRFSHVAVWRDPFLGGTVDHHTVVYEYASARLQRSLNIDWGREGITYKFGQDDPCPNGDIINRKWCRLNPAEVRKHLLAVLDWEYDLVRWNCQHFSQYMFEKAAEAFSSLPDVHVPDNQASNSRLRERDSENESKHSPATEPVVERDGQSQANL